MANDWVSGFGQDLRFSARLLRKNLGFAAVAVLTLAVGIAACTAIFSVFYEVLLRPLPYPEPGQIVQVWQVNKGGKRARFADPNYDDLRAQNHSFAALAEVTSRIASVSGAGEPVRTVVTYVSPDFFDVFGVRPALGRTFLSEEQRQHGRPVAIVSHGMWQRSLGGAQDFARTLKIEGALFTVIGVMPPGFEFPAATEIWVPREIYPHYTSRTAHNFAVFGRLKPEVTLSQARADASTIARRLREQYGEQTWMVDAAVIPLREQVVGSVRAPLLLLLAAVGVLMMIASANVANLLLAQAASRQREVAVRTALGATRVRLIRQFMAESLVLAASAGLLGVIAARWGIRLLLAMKPSDLPRSAAISINLPVLSFALALTLATALLLGVVAALRSARLGTMTGLQQAAATVTGAGQRMRSALVACQVAFSVMLLVAAGLLGHSFLRLLAVQPGFRLDHLVAMSFSQASSDNPEDDQRLARFRQDLLARVRAIPGVEAAAGANALPLSGSGADGQFLVDNNEADKGYAEYRLATADYFGVLGIPLLRGRLFSENDGPNSAQVAVISESLARSKWAGEDPIGKRIQFGNMDGDQRLMTIVGVVGDIRDRGLETPPAPTLYGNAMQRPQSGSFSIVIRTAMPPASVMAAARGMAREMDPDLPVRFRTLDEMLASAVSARRFSMTLLAVFAASALLLASMGIYGVTAYSVVRRTREIGIRMALGARRGQMLVMVLRQELAWVLLGGLAGLAGAAVVARLLAAMLFGIRPSDPATFTFVAGVLGLTALAAAYWPARRAGRVDPMVALRHD